ncbi:helix-turn-helix domain-containing protein [Rhodococcus sp. JG-3]|uniref:excisionase family DNA-binding protein n=1 Tax=Rhodococcus sp. JG-3 TaxID=1305835 RepID=UPI0004287109|nr:helix-turn-helix domain-containing protein [Rhodococcus sp. JG-3]
MARLNGIDTVLERTNLGKTAIYGYISTGELRSVKVGRRRLFSDDAIDDFIRRLESSVQGGAA